MARSRAGGRRAPGAPAASRAAAERSGAGLTSGPVVTLGPALPTPPGLTCRPLPDPTTARPLFDYVALPWPDPARVVLAWGAWIPGPHGERLAGALLGEGPGRSLMIHGPVMSRDVADHGGPEPLEVASALVVAVLDGVAAAGVDTVFARPQGLDRVWIRHGFIPLPEVSLPPGLRGRPGFGLYGWRGGSALWALREPARD